MRITKYMLFASIYGVLLLAVSLAADQLGSASFAAATGWVAPFAVAPLALLAAARVGHLTKPGIAVTSVILAAVMCLTTVGILIAVAVPVVGGPTLDDIARMFSSYFTIGGWGLLLGFVALVAAPLLWETVLASIKGSRETAAA